MPNLAGHFKYFQVYGSGLSVFVLPFFPLLNSIIVPFSHSHLRSGCTLLRSRTANKTDSITCPQPIPVINPPKFCLALGRATKVNFLSEVHILLKRRKSCIIPAFIFLKNIVTWELPQVYFNNTGGTNILRKHCLCNVNLVW